MIPRGMRSCLCMFEPSSNFPALGTALDSLFAQLTCITSPQQRGPPASVQQAADGLCSAALVP